jgi:adenylate cyclase
VRYVLEGSVRRSGVRVRVVAQLIEAETGNHIWADRYDRALEDVFAVQDEITEAVTTAIVPSLMDAEQRRALRKPPENLGAWEAYQRGLWHMEKYNAIDTGKAQHFFERAIALDAGFAAAHVALSRVFTFHTWVSCTLSIDEGRRLTEIHAREAVAIDPNDPEALARLAWCRSELGNGKEALEVLSPVLARNPNSALANGVYGLTLVSLGHRSDGRAALLKAMRLNPRDRIFPCWIAVSHYYDANYDSAVTMANTAIERYPDYPIIYKWLAAALGQLGRLDEARAALRHAIEVSPKSFELLVRSRLPYFRPEDYEHMLDGLRKAGWHG